MREPIEKTWGWDETWQRNDFEARFRECLVSIVEAGGEDVGCLWLRSEPGVLYVADVQITPARQGRGIGTSVLQGVIALASERGVAVELAVLQVNPRARRLYERLGFRVTEAGAPFVRMRHDGSADTERRT
jgi:ribosomal protein S18 acetylase RimI-like enzyme